MRIIIYNFIVCNIEYYCLGFEPNFWAGLKHHLKKYVKPANKEELIDGIKGYWRGLTKETCQQYIGHVQK